jgi:peptide-methionine (S)-S-oxide reductase
MKGKKGKAMTLGLFGAGCFWGVEENFRTFPGVVETEVGYGGGHTDKPTYRAVCDGGTGHIELVKVTFDPSLVSYEQLVRHFFSIHDPTTLDRQGPDVGEQYRSVIFTFDEEQEKQARAVLRELEQEQKFSRPIVTKIAPFVNFTAGEEYHQKYALKNGWTCVH